MTLPRTLLFAFTVSVALNTTNDNFEDWFDDMRMSLGALTVQQTYDYAREAGFDPTRSRQMVAIAQRESALNPTVVGTISPGEASYGLWQINMGNNLGSSRLQQFGISSPDELKDPLTNAKAAYKLWNGNDANLAAAWQINNYNSPYGYAQKYQQNLQSLPPVDALEANYSGSAATIDWTHSPVEHNHGVTDPNNPDTSSDTSDTSEDFPITPTIAAIGGAFLIWMLFR